MPYELEYKKVHNTLSKKNIGNVYGYLEGQVINKIIQDEDNHTCKVFLTNAQRQFVIQNNSLDSLNLSITAFTEEGQSVKFKESGAIPYSFSIDFGESIIIEITNNQIVYQESEGVYKELIPNYIIIEGSSDQWVMWETNDNIIGYSENDIIIKNEYVDTEDIIKIEFENFSWSEAYNFIDQITMIFEDDDNSCIIRFGYPSSTIPTSLYNMNFDIVLVPMRVPIRNKTPKEPTPLRSITNMRNEHQISLYGPLSASQYTEISLYLEPISLYSSGTSALRTAMGFDKHHIESGYEAPLPRDCFTQTQSRRTYTTYGLKKNRYNWALFVCRGCGYDGGPEAGYTQIRFAIGIQKKKNNNPHSGCSLEYIKCVNDYTIRLPRLALIAKNNKNSVIKYEE